VNRPGIRSRNPDIGPVVASGPSYCAVRTIVSETRLLVGDWLAPPVSNTVLVKATKSAVAPAVYKAKINIAHLRTL